MINLTYCLNGDKKGGQTNRGAGGEEERSKVKLVLGNTLDGQPSDKSRTHSNSAPNNLK